MIIILKRKTCSLQIKLNIDFNYVLNSVRLQRIEMFFNILWIYLAGTCILELANNRLLIRDYLYHFDSSRADRECCAIRCTLINKEKYWDISLCDTPESVTLHSNFFEKQRSILYKLEHFDRKWNSVIHLQSWR